MSYQEGALHHVLIESTTTVQGAAPETIRMRGALLEVRAPARIETELNELDFGENDLETPCSQSLKAAPGAAGSMSGGALKP